VVVWGLRIARSILMRHHLDSVSRISSFLIGLRLRLSNIPAHSPEAPATFNLALGRLIEGLAVGFRWNDPFSSTPYRERYRYVSHVPTVSISSPMFLA